MRKSLMTLFNLVALLSLATAAFALEGNVAAIGIPIGMALAAAGCGIAQGLGLKAACDGTARNPDAGQKIMVTLILGLAFIESLSIYALVLNFLLLP